MSQIRIIGYQCKLVPPTKIRDEDVVEVDAMFLTLLQACIEIDFGKIIIDTRSAFINVIQAIRNVANPFAVIWMLMYLNPAPRFPVRLLRHGRQANFDIL